MIIAMRLPPSKDDLAKMTNWKLIRFKNKLIRDINRAERNNKVPAAGEGECQCRVIAEDEDIIYEWNIRDLMLVLKEINKRMQEHEWIF